MRVRLIVNARAGRGDGVHQVIADGLAARGFEVVQEGAVDELAADADCDLVVLAGGDGTLNHALPALIKWGLPVGLVPTGTANDFARTLDLPTDIEAALDVIAAGTVRPADVGTVNDRYFLNVASMGLAVMVAENLTDATKQRFGKLGYAVTALQVVLQRRRFTAWIESAEGTVQVRTLQIAIGNGVHYGGGNIIHADAAIDDAQLDLYSLEFTNLWRLFAHLPWFRTGTHGRWEEVRTLHGTWFRVTTSRPRRINTDGDVTTTTPATFGVIPGAIRVLVP